MAISVAFIPLNLRVDPRVCYRCHTDCMRFNASSKILFLIAEGLPNGEDWFMVLLVFKLDPGSRDLSLAFTKECQGCRL